MERRHYARFFPYRAVSLKKVEDTLQVFVQDKQSPPQQLTSEPHGVGPCYITPSGASVIWWRPKERGSQFGSWRIQPFETPPGGDRPLSTDLPPVYQSDRLDVVRDHLIYFLAHLPPDWECYDVAVKADRVISFSPSALSLTTDPLPMTISALTLADPFTGERLDPPWLLYRGFKGMHLVHRSKTFLLPGPAEGTVAVRWSNGNYYRSLFILSHDESLLWVAYDHNGQTVLCEHSMTDIFQPRLLDTPPGTIRHLGQVGEQGVEFEWGAISHDWVTLQPGEQPPPAPKVRWEHVWVPWPGGPEHILEIPVVLVYPDGDPPRHGWPLVVFVHGGPHTHSSDEPLSPEQEQLRKEGCVLLMVNYPGSTGYGPEYLEAAFGRLVVTEAESIIAATRWTFTERSINPERVVARGGSYSGMPLLVAACLDSTIFQGVSLDAPVIDPRFKWENAPNRWEKEVWERRIGGSPTEAPALWDAASPLSYIDRLRCPVSIVSFDDERSPLDHVQEYAAANPDLVSFTVIPDSHYVSSQREATARAAASRQVSFILKTLNLGPRRINGIRNERWRRDPGVIPPPRRGRGGRPPG